MSKLAEYAIPLFSLIDASKVDLNRPLPDDLGEQLGMYLEGHFGIKSLSTQLVVLDQQPFLVLHAVKPDCLPALCSLVDVQRTQLYRYQRTDQDTVTLTPLNVRVQD